MGTVLAILTGFGVLYGRLVRVETKIETLMSDHRRIWDRIMLSGGRRSYDQSEGD